MSRLSVINLTLKRLEATNRPIVMRRIPMINIKPPMDVVNLTFQPTFDVLNNPL